MALSGMTLFDSLPASADLSAAQFKFVVLDSSGDIAVVAGAGADAIGILVDKPDAAGVHGRVDTFGSTKVLAGAAITAGDKIQSGSDGRALTAASGDHAVGYAKESAAAAGEVINVYLKSNHILA